MLWARKILSSVLARFEFNIPLGRRIVALAAVLLATVYCGNAVIVYHYYRAVAQHEHSTRQIRAHLLADHVSHDLKAIDSSLIILARTLAKHLPLNQTGVRLILNTYRKNLPGVQTLSVIGHHGRIVNSTDPFGPSSVSLADHNYFTEQKNWRGLGIYLGPVASSRGDHAPYLGVGRPILDTHGNYEGTILAVLKPKTFTGYVGADANYKNDVTLLERTDGKILLGASNKLGATTERYRWPVSTTANVLKHQIDGFPLKVVVIGSSVFWSPEFLSFVGLNTCLLLLMTFIAMWLVIRAARQTAAIAREGEARRKAEARLLSAIESAPAAFALYDKEDRLVLSNTLFGSFLEPVKDLIVPGSTSNALAEACVDRRIYADQHLRNPDFLRWRRDQNRRGDGELLLQMRTGRWLLVRERCTGEGDAVFFLTDVTRLKEREEELRRVNEVQSLFVDALNHIPSALILCDAADRIVYCNSVAQKYFPGAVQLLVPGTPFEMLLRAHAASGHVKGITDVDTWVTERMAQHRSAIMELAREYADGCWSQVIERRTDTGCSIGIRTDITDLKRTEEALRQSEQIARIAQQEAERSNRAKTAFLANMSHELRTPLNAIIGFSEMIEKCVMGPISETYRNYGEIVRTSGQHLLAIINDLLDIAKLNAGKTELHLKPVDINKVIADAVSIVSVRATSVGVQVVSKLDPTNPIIQADALRLRQVMLNLLTNAIKFTPAGGYVDISTWAQLDELQIVVQDNGKGMAAEDIPRALEPFTQVCRDEHDTIEGTGLGLPISKALVELHGGRFAIASTPKVGTTVTVTLLFQRGATPAPDPPLDIAV